MTTISTAAFYDRANFDMAALRGRAEGLQAAIGRSERLARSSDDPVAAARLRTLARADALSQVSQAGSDRAEADLALADGAVSEVGNAVIRARELAMKAAGGTLTPEQRRAVGVELAGLADSLLAVANGRDSAGHALFGGETSGAAYARDAAGVIAYIGTATSGEAALGDGQTVARSVTGPEVFAINVPGQPADLFAVIAGLGAALQSGTGDPVQAARDALVGLDAGLDKVTTAQTVIGTRLNWIDQTNERRTALSEQRADEQSTIGGTDLTGTITQLQQAMTVLQASQASFSKLASLSLFELLR